MAQVFGLLPPKQETQKKLLALAVTPVQQRKICFSFRITLSNKQIKLKQVGMYLIPLSCTLKKD